MADSVRYLKGVGEKNAKYLEKLGVLTTSDLTRLFPRRYEDIGNIVAIGSLHLHRGEKVSIYGTVSTRVTETRIAGGRTLTTAYVADESGQTRIVWFNNKFIKNMLKEGCRYIFYGKIPEDGVPAFTAPEFYDKLPTGGRLLPIYPLVSGLKQKLMRKIVAEALDRAKFLEPLPESITEKYGLIPYPDAVRKIHQPKAYADINDARRRHIFDELLYFSLGLQLLRGREKTAAAVTVSARPHEFIDAHGFTPTDAQTRALLEIYKDLESGYTMNRLLQGDVGSGKTLVAGQSAYCVIKSGAQAAIMAPTEVLANQHYRYFEKMMVPLGVRVELLTSSVPAAKKREIKRAAEAGEVDFIVGTHAVIQKDVRFKNLGLVITDEQHRFGVMQRSELAGKGSGVHILVMSATPIPRTLALMMWGDLDLSVIDELPGGRHKVQTFLVDESYNKRLNAFIKKQIDLGGRVYVVCPMIEDGEESDLTSVKARFDGLCKLFGDDNVGLVHGKLKAAEKDRVMTEFADGKKSILVSTTVIEVGINVPEATLMIIENAERFGLSQLHQLRGRVGRGNMQAYCVLVSNSNTERLSYFTKTTDGFKIASKDLELRGPGNFFGKDQHGLPRMQVADMQQDMDTLQNAAECAKALLESDPTLYGHPRIRENVLNLFESKGEIFN